jgi:hypothetical protein
MQDYLCFLSRTALTSRNLMNPRFRELLSPDDQALRLLVKEFKHKIKASPEARRSSAMVRDGPELVLCLCCARFAFCGPRLLPHASYCGYPLPRPCLYTVGPQPTPWLCLSACCAPPPLARPWFVTF